MKARRAAPEWDRFAHWRAWPARLLLGVLAALLVLAAIAPLSASMEGEVASVPSMLEQGSETGDAAGTNRDNDLAFYDRVIERIAAGENYYDFVVAEQRARDYPVRPGLAVRLPTLAYMSAALGQSGMVALAILLLAATGWAWWQRLGAEPGGLDRRAMATALILFGAALGLNRDFFVLHELWAGGLIALAFGLHRPGKWKAALFAAALAVAIRELALPFILLMGAIALWRRNWTEGAAWGGLAVLFAAALLYHLSLIDPQALPTDREGPDWLVFRGFSGWLGNIVLTSNLRFLPHAVASPLVVLMVLGWAGWRSPAGTTGTFLYLGYALAFMIAGRANNFYWGMIAAPAMFLGLAFVPMALGSLIRAARGDQTPVR